MKRLAAMLLLLAGPVLGQDLRYSDDPTARCLSQAATGLQKRACIGLSANACMAATPDGSTTWGMGGCLDQELSYWDAGLNASYREIMAKARANDAEMKRIGATAPAIEPALRDMQRAWIAWRDLTCDYERAQWGGGTGGGPATLSCLMRLTAEQTLYLADSWLGE